MVSFRREYRLTPNMVYQGAEEVEGLWIDGWAENHIRSELWWVLRMVWFDDPGERRALLKAFLRTYRMHRESGLGAALRHALDARKPPMPGEDISGYVTGRKRRPSSV